MWLRKRLFRFKETNAESPRSIAGMRVFPLALLLAGCSFSSNPTAADGSPQDAAVDGAPPLTDAATMLVDPVCGGAFTSVCVEMPAAALTLETQTIDTATSSRCVATRLAPGLDACVIAASSIVIPGNHTVTVTGRRPLVLLSTTTITISGVLDAASHQVTSMAGPGADAGPCPSNEGNAVLPTAGPMGDGGGGFGGSFGGAGNNGGNGALAGQGGTAAPAISATTLRGGCPASSGAGTHGGAAGRGGGAVLLIAAQTLSIDGTVNASGAAGAAGKMGGGGGGGGSGGMIILDADTVNTTGKVFANGGGGGEGGNNTMTEARAGAEPTAPNAAAAGGRDGTMFGGDGGDGGFGTMLSGLPGGNGAVGSAGGGGGGGGGGVGVIRIFARQQNNTNDLAKVSPRAT